ISINSLNGILQCEKLEQITISASNGISCSDVNNNLSAWGLNQEFNVIPMNLVIKPHQDPHYQYSYPRDFSRLYRRAAENSEIVFSEIVFTRSNIYEIYNIRDPSLR
ncbi:29953_t:CDS:2, partial [Racocetra persica]